MLLGLHDDHRDGPRVDRRSLLRLAASGAAFLMTPALAFGATRAGAVEDVRGEAFAEAEQRRRELERAAPLFIGDRVGTGADSRAVLRLGEATTLRLGERARLTIDRFLVNAGGEISLQSGPILFDRPASSPAPLQIRSTFGLIAVRGTRFFAGPSKGVFGVFVERGSVRVSGGGRTVTVRARQGTDIARPGAAPTTPAPWKPPRIRAALASVR